ncbi:unnamed protein product [Phyllotreta striolata]|uniref:OPA3-like protein n=1 Tax=Phyllotreta striolata TaxID=444603 RepID=A0A9N9XMD5_PHYSR|nr:unnamed protein product [Phyllotreta striolata]
MVVGAFPAAKLGALLLKQISKPIANALKSQAKSSPVFRKYICMPPAQFYNWCEVKAKMWILNLGKPVNVPVLNEAMAIELGANLLGEGIIFIIAAGVVIAEYNRSSKKEAAKEEAKTQEMEDIRNTMRELFIQTEEQAAQLRELTRKLGDIDTKLGIANTTMSSTKSQPPRKADIKNSESGKDKRKDVYIVQTPDVSYQSNENIAGERTNFAEYSSPKRPYNNVILKAIDDIEDMFCESPLIERQENNILFLSLYHINALLRLND